MLTDIVFGEYTRGKGYFLRNLFDLDNKAELLKTVEWKKQKTKNEN